MRHIGGTVGGSRALMGALLLGGLAVPRPATAQASHEREVLNVMFVGNSQMNSNNLGDIVAGIAAADPMGPIIVPTMTNERRAGGLFAGDTDWDYMIFQALALFPGNIEPKHVTIWPEPEREFVIGDVEVFYSTTRRLVTLARAAEAKSILFPSPPRQMARFDSDVPQVWKQVMDAHLSIARELDVDVAPIQEVFEETRQRLISVNTYMYDMSHPSEEGSYLEALVVYSMITGRDPAGAPTLIYGRPFSYKPGPNVVNNNLRVPLVDLRLAIAMELQKVAWEAVQKRERTGSN